MADYGREITDVLLQLLSLGLLSSQSRLRPISGALEAIQTLTSVERRLDPAGPEEYAQE